MPSFTRGASGLGSVATSYLGNPLQLAPCPLLQPFGQFHHFDVRVHPEDELCPLLIPPIEIWDKLTTQDKLDWLNSQSMIYWPKRGDMPRFKRYLSTVEGTRIADVMTDIHAVMGSSAEKTGYPTQKPLAFYERIICLSSNEGDIVVDPFAGCATTLVAAEKLNRQWTGMDIWDRVHEVVVNRLRSEVGLFGDVHFTTAPPVRTDEGEEAAPFLRVKERVKEPEGRKMSRAEMYDFLLTQHGPRCQGCDRTFDDPRYLELDHNTPRSDGGLNHISNRILLCGPCNKLKSNQYTLSGLRRQNRRNGYMVNV